MTQQSLILACQRREEAEAYCAAFTNLEQIRIERVYHTGKELLAHLNAHAVAGVLTDLFLPDMDAFDLVAGFSALPKANKPAVFALSPVCDDRFICTIREHIVYCFVKPVQPELIALRTMQMLRAESLERITNKTVHERIEGEVAACIRSLGVPAHLKGYYYLRDAVMQFVLELFPANLSITADVYPAIAKQYGTQPTLVEHAMRNAIETAWTRGNIDVIYSYFGYTVNDHKGKPSNLEFVAMIADHVASRYRIRR